MKFKTGNVLFVGCGAFSGIESVAQTKASIGFDEKSDAVSHCNHSESLCRYGLMRELVGRFGNIVSLAPHSSEDLLHILQRNTVRQYDHELRLSGIDLRIEPEVLHNVVDGALERGTGARGLASGMIALLEAAMFEAYSSCRAVKALRLYQDGETIQWGFEYPVLPHVEKHQDLAEVAL